MAGPNDGPAGPDRPLPPELDPRGPARRPGTAPGAKRVRSPHRRRRIMAWVAGSLAAVIALAAVTGWVAVDQLLGNIKKIDVFGGLSNRPSGGVIGDLNILVVGSDSRAGL